MPSPEYIELHARSAFSFLRGGSLPERLAETAASLGLPALAVCDRMGVYGAPRLRGTAQEVGIRPIYGAELAMDDGSALPVLVETRQGYQNLCRLLTQAHLRAPKGEGVVWWDELPEFAEGLVALTGDEEGPLVAALKAEGREAVAAMGAPRKFSPLTPALSPLRGEGARSVPASENKPVAAFVAAGSFYHDDGTRRRVPEPVTASVATPSPLNGERAGVRGEAVRQAYPFPRAADALSRLVRIFGAHGVFVEIQRHLRRGEERVNRALTDLARAHNLPLLATNGVMHATPEGRQVADVFTCLRHHTNLDAAGRLLAVNDERHLKSPAQMAALFADLPDAVANTTRLADRLRFELGDLGYEFPRYPTGPGETQEGVLREWTFRGARGRYHGEIPEKVRALLEKELALINKLGFAGYFLIVADLCRYCREHAILAQGRGSAANSAVCFCLGITAVDPVRFNVLFERFLSESRKGWPDIDLDLPSGDRREQVIQEVYRRYGRHGAAMTGTIITYRGRSSARELGKVLGLPADVIERFSNLAGHGDFPETMQLVERMEMSGLSRAHPRVPAFASLFQQIGRLPRHLGQHSGGMIICQDSLHRFIPLENASMPGRVVAQWDKDDCEELGIIKVDLLGLGMMAALQDCVTLTRARGRPVDLAQLPEDDPKTFELLQRADTIGVFQVESRAQMATLPRMKPKTFYDLVVEVALIRPGPIQGDLAHPYLRRRNGEEVVTYYAPQLKPVLERTLGVPLFQEQMLQLAMIMADFSGDEAEELRRAMSFHRSEEKMRRAEERLRAAMDRAGVNRDIAERIVKAVGSFALYGFPESHAISFAHLAYASAYLKAHRAPEFFCALLNNQPMGFYSPATLVKDAKRFGVQVRPVCVMRSNWETLIEPGEPSRMTADPGVTPNSAISSLSAPSDAGKRAGVRWGGHPSPPTPFHEPKKNVQRSTFNVERSKLDVERWKFSAVQGFKARNRPVGNSFPVEGSGEPNPSGAHDTAKTPDPHTVATRPEGSGSLRLGLRQVQGLRQERVEAMLVERAKRPFASLDDFKARTRFNKDELRTLAEIGALNCFAAHRRAAMWEAERERREGELFGMANEPAGDIGHSSLVIPHSPLPPMAPLERLQADYASLRLTTGAHPMAMVRARLPEVWRAADLKQVKNGELVRVAGQVICRQRPGTAKGVCFVSLEDETGISNVIVWPKLFEAERLKITMEPFLSVEGVAQSKHGTIHVVARRIERLDFAELQTAGSHDFG